MENPLDILRNVNMEFSFLADFYRNSIYGKESTDEEKEYADFLWNKSRETTDKINLLLDDVD